MTRASTSVDRDAAEPEAAGRQDAVGDVVADRALRTTPDSAGRCPLDRAERLPRDMSSCAMCGRWLRRRTDAAEIEGFSLVCFKGECGAAVRAEGELALRRLPEALEDR